MENGVRRNAASVVSQARVLIVEDEQHARRYLRELLEDEAQIDLVGESHSNFSRQGGLGRNGAMEAENKRPMLSESNGRLLPRDHKTDFRAELTTSKHGPTLAALLQLPFNLRNRGVAILGLLTQAAFDDSFQFLRRILYQFAQRRGFLAGYRDLPARSSDPANREFP